jgi:predicted Ser/Thr protein kinase
MGTTYLARQVSLKRLVAIKVLRRDLSKDKQYVERFHREARLAAELDHPNIAQAIDVGEISGLHYMVMEYVEGRVVADFIPEGGALDERLALHVVRQVARALEAGREHGVIHRDIKPDNILLTKDNTAKLCDFGLAKKLGGESHLTQSGMAVGTPHYCSPEQAQGDQYVDIRSDIYSLGATLFHLVTGRLPYEADNAAAVAVKHITESVPQARKTNPAVSEGTDRLITTMMAKKPAQRYQTPAQLIADIDKVVAGEAIGIQVMPVDAGTASSSGEGGGPSKKPTLPVVRPAARRGSRRTTRAVSPLTGSWPRLLGRLRPLLGLAVALVVGGIVYYTFFSEDAARRRLAEIEREFKVAEEWWQRHPRQFDEALKRFRAVQARAVGTELEKTVGEAIARVTAARDGKPPEPKPGRPPG